MRFLLLITLLLPGTLAAQDKLPKTSLSVYSFRYAENLETVFLRSDVEGFQKIELSTANLLGPFTAALSGGAITFHKEDKNDAGETIYPIIARAKIPASIKQPIALLLPAAPDAKLPYLTLIVDQSKRDFPMGSYKLINLAPHGIRAAVGKSRLEAKPGGIKLLKPTEKPGSMVQVLFQYHDGQRWRKMTETRWAIRKDRRSLVCAYLDPRDKRMKMRSIPARIPAPPVP